MILPVLTRDGEYPIYLERGLMKRAGEYLDLDRRCLVITDENIPERYVKTLLSQIRTPCLLTLPAGEESKTLRSFEKALEVMLDNGFTRSDCVIALGGGVIGDLAGFVAASYQRGVDFYNVPTTILSQVDSSIGGKVAVNFMGLKNMVGAFYPPKAVLIDPETLGSLPQRQIANGLAEAVKMAMTFNEDLFCLMEEKDPMVEIDQIIEESLRAKKRVVEEDERESGVRRVLNFGHTLAHAIESESHKTGQALYHGESVALGMIPMTDPALRPRLCRVLEKLSLPTHLPFAPADLIEAMSHDKKMAGDSITVVYVDKLGTYRMEKMPFSAFAEEVKGWKE